MRTMKKNRLTRHTRKKMIVFAVTAALTVSVGANAGAAGAEQGKPIKSSVQLSQDLSVVIKKKFSDMDKRAAALYADHTYPIEVDMNTFGLHLQVASKSYESEVYGIFADHSDVHVFHGESKKPLVLNVEGKNEAHGIYGVRGSKIRIDQDVKIEKVSYKRGAYGIFSAEFGSDVTINGGFEIKKSVVADSKKLNHAFGAFASGSASIHFLKPVSVDIDGTAMQTMSDSSLIEAAGGTVSVGISLSPKKKYYAFSAGQGKILFNMKDESEVGSAVAQVKGNIITTQNLNKVLSGGHVFLGLSGEESFWNGIVDAAIGADRDYKGKLDLHVRNGAIWRNQRIGNPWDGWTGSRISVLAGGDSEAEKGIIFQKEETPIRIDSYKGHTMVMYQHDETDPTKIIGGEIHINSVAAGSEITLRTDHTGLNVDSRSEESVKAVKDTLHALANKLYYQAYVTGERNLTGKVEIAEGLTAQSVSKKLGAIAFKETDGQGEYNAAAPSPDPGNPRDPIIYGPKETAMMRGAKSAMAGTVLTWRAENNDLAKRMGNLRLSHGEAGAWGRIYGGKMSYDKDHAEAKTTFRAVQVGYDKIVSDSWRAGVAFSYLDGDNKYGGRSTGDTKLTNLALYGTKIAGDGSYIDLVAKASRLANDYTIYSDMGKKLEGDYNTWGVMASAEVGRRKDLGSGSCFGYYGQVIYGHVAGKDYDARSDFEGGKRLHVSQDGWNTFVGRAGIRLCHESGSSSWNLKAAAAHEFAGKFKTRYAADGESTGSTEQDMKDTWFELGLDGTLRLGTNQYLYANVERSFGADLETDWRIDAGIRLFF